MIPIVSRKIGIVNRSFDDASEKAGGVWSGVSLIYLATFAIRYFRIVALTVGCYFGGVKHRKIESIKEFPAFDRSLLF